MKQGGRIILSAALRGAAWAGVAVAGFLLPVDFFTQIDSLRMSLRPMEIVANASFAWILYFGIAAVAGALGTGAIAGLLLFLRRYDDRLVRVIGHSIIALLIGQRFVRAAFRWAPDMDGRVRWALIVIIVAAFAAWVVTRHAAILDRVRGFLSAVTAVGAIMAGVTIVSAFMGSRDHVEKPQAANGSRRRVILISIDSLAANRMSLYGYLRDTTPSLNKFADEAFVFDRHYTNGNFTTPSIGSILTGLRPWEHRTLQLNSRPRPFIAQRGLIPTLKRSGYDTVAIATNPYAMPELHRVDGWLDSERFGRVDIAEFWFVRLFPAFGSVMFFPTVDNLQRLCTRIMYAKDTRNLYFDPESAFAQARASLARQPRNNNPEFLWVHLFPPHYPYAAPAPFLRSLDRSDKALTAWESAPPPEFVARVDSSFPGALSGRYDESIRYVDYHIGRFLTWLKTEHYYDDSLIIVTADHGESFGHSYGFHAGPMLYEELVHVPLLIKLPGQHTGTRIHDLVTEHADLFPTILDCINLPVPQGLEGRTFRPALEGRSVQPRSVFTMNFEQNSDFGPLRNGTVALIDGRYKYVRHLGHVSYPYMPKLHDELYDVISDPAETADLAATKPELAASMRSAIDTAVAEHSKPLAQ